MNNIVLFIFGGLLWGVLGFGLGLVFPMFRAQRRLGAVEDAVRSRRATAQDREIEISPAMRLFVTDANGGSHVTFVEDSGAAVQVLADRAVTNLAHWWRGPTVAGAASPRRSRIELMRASPRRVPPPPPVPAVRPSTPEDKPA